MQVVKKLRNHPKSPKKISLVLAEEQHFSGKLQKINLSSGGFTVHLVNSPSDLLSYISENTVQVIMIDVHFHAEGDVNYLFEIKRKSLNKDIKIILTSVLPLRNIIDVRVKKYVDLFVVKPMPRVVLIEKIKKIVDAPIRQALRYKVNYPILLQMENEKVTLRVIDMSTNGLLIEDKKRAVSIDSNDDLKLELMLPTYKSRIKFKGKVIRFTKEGFGLKITKISEESLTKIEKTLERENQNKDGQIYYL